MPWYHLEAIVEANLSAVLEITSNVFGNLVQSVTNQMNAVLMSNTYHKNIIYNATALNRDYFEYNWVIITQVMSDCISQWLPKHGYDKTSVQVCG